MAGAERAESPDTILDDILLSHRSLQVDCAFALELTDHGDNLLLGRLDLFDLDGTEGVHVFLQHFGAALRHRSHKVGTKLIARTFESNGQQLSIEFRKNFFD